MRVTVAILFGIFIAALIVSAVIAGKSVKPIGRSLRKLQVGILVPLIGNLIIILSGKYFYSLAGYYIYFIGMDIAVYCAIRFTMDYCEMRWPFKALKYIVWGLIAVDGIQYFLNPIYHHSFTLQAIKLNGYNYYLLVTFAGQTYHRIVAYGMFVIALVLCIVKQVNSPKIYRERYSVVTVAMIMSCLLESFYIFSRTPMDLSMTAIATYGLLVFYLALYYRPMKVLDRMLAKIASDLNESLFFYDLSGKCLWANEPALKITGVDTEDYELASKNIEDMFGDVKNGSESWSVKKTSDDGEQRFYNLEFRTMSDDKGRLTGSFLCIMDKTEEQLEIQREIYDATHDKLTGLYTKEYMYEQIGKTLMSEPDTKYYVIFFDVNNFKIVNDVFGTKFGDLALKRIAEWLIQISSPNCVFGRIAGDTFGALMPVDEFDEKYIDDCLSSFDIKEGNKEHRLIIHCGVIEVTDHDMDVSVLFDRAHLAINKVKDDYNVHVAYYDDNVRNNVLREQMIASQLNEAIEKRQIVPYLQPIVDSSGRVLGAEALARWIHPTEGFMAPDSFIPVFERNGMIADVDLHIWRCSCEILKRWQDMGQDMFISINISPKDFYFMDVPYEIINLVSEFGIKPHRLRIEITETVLMDDVENRMKDIGRLRSAGFLIEMDDFGSGYSSLNMLQDMPVDVLKIDMGFLRKAEVSQKAEMIIYNILAMAKDLDITSLTEGVESQYQFEQLSRMGCKLFQGYHFSKPIPVEEFEKYSNLKEAS